MASASAPADVPPRRRALRARPAMWAAGLAVLTAAAAAAWMWPIDDDGPGPLGSEEIHAISVGRHVGETTGYGLSVVYNRGDEEAVLDRIELVNPTPGLRVLDTRLAGPRRRFRLGASTTGPPEREITDVHPVRGYRVAPVGTWAGDRGVELLFTVRADRPGRYQFTRVAVDYHVGDNQHRVILRHGMRVCVVPRGIPRPRSPACRPPDP